jgi:hypothetical protein
MPRNSPKILGFVADLIFAVRIEEAARQLGLQVQWIERAEQISHQESQPGESGQRQVAEHLLGPGADLMDKLTSWQPVLVIFDLGNSFIPWRDWLAWMKSSAATRRIPVICYGSHVDGQTLKAAQDRGADLVVARSKFSSDLPDLIRQYARLPDLPGLEETCQQPLSARAIHGLELFNQGEYFEAHEVLELAWNEDQSAGRELYRAILQVAVAYLQIERGNYNGAMKMFLRVRQWIDPLPDVCRGVQVEKLRQEAQAVLEHLTVLGKERIGHFDRSLFKPICYQKVNLGGDSLT